MASGLPTDLAYSVQLVIGGVFVASAIPKLRAPGEFRRVVAEYELLPRRAAAVVAPAVAGVELAVACALLSGWVAEVAVGVALALLLAFLFATTVNLRRGRAISCGCFGNVDERISAWTLARLAILVVACCTLAVLYLVGGVSPMTLTRAGAHAEPAAYELTVAAVAAGLAVGAMWLLNVPQLRTLAGRPAAEPARSADA